MPSITFQSRTYGLDPMRALEQKQNAEFRQKKRIIEGDDCKNWSPARKAAEELFDIPAGRKP